MTIKKDLRFIRLKAARSRIRNFRKKISAEEFYVNKEAGGGRAAALRYRSLTRSQRKALDINDRRQLRIADRICKQRKSAADKLKLMRIDFWLAWFAWPENRFWHNPGSGAFAYADRLIAKGCANV